MRIVYVDEKSVLIKEEDKFTQFEEIKLGKEDIITSSLNISEVISYIFKLPKTGTIEELKPQAEIYFYENAGLDLTKKYKTFYLFKEIEQDEDNFIVEAIAVAEDVLSNKYKDVVSEYRFIDYISLSFLSFETFYNLYKKEKKRDAFVYLDDKNSFISVFEDGKYLYARTLPSLNIILKNIGIDYNKFTEIISSKGLDKEEYNAGEEIIVDELNRFFSDYFMNINNRISYGRSIFYLENVDNIYFYTPFEIKGLDELKTFWDLSGINFEKLPIENVDFLNKVSLEYNSLHYQDEVNFSIFPRPPKFYKTKTFHLFLVIFISSLIFGGDYFYRDYTNKQLQQQIKTIKSRLNKKNSELTVLRAKNQAILEEVTKYEKEIGEIQTKIDFIRDVLKASFNYLDLPKTNKDFLLLSNLLQKYKLETVLITYKENQFFIAVYTKTNKRDSISKFMNDLIYAGYKNVRTNEINNINNLYTSVIRFEK